MIKTYGILFVLTGIFAIAGGFYTWGDGSIFDNSQLIKVLIPWADIILTGPLSLICGYGLIKNKKWGQALGLITSGIYSFGSLLVFITMIWNKDFSIFLIVPAFSGLLIALGFVYSYLRKE